jgi:uncharacterized protein (TIGR02145 family)
MKKFWIYSLAILGVFSIILASCEKNENTGVAPSTKGGIVTDIDGNQYSTVTIGTQTWMIENLKVIKYRDGTSIPNITDNTQWKNLTTGGYCTYNNIVSNASSYGCLYNWYAINDSRNLAPVGWHIPTDEDWAILVDYLGGDSFAGSKMKETGTTHWLKPNTNAINTYNFTGLPGGMRNGNGYFFEMTTTAYWWSSTNLLSEAYFRKLVYNDIYVGRDLSYLNAGFSVRCIRDN